MAFGVTVFSLLFGWFGGWISTKAFSAQLKKLHEEEWEK